MVAASGHFVQWRFVNWTITPRRILYYVIVLFQANSIGVGDTCAEVLDQYKAAVVKITATVDGKRRTGTGFIFKLDAEGAHILTASHVVEGDPEPQVEFFSGEHSSLKAQVRKIEGGDSRGLALMTVSAKQNLPSDLLTLPIEPTILLQAGDEVITIGFPVGGGAWALSKATINGREGRDLILTGAMDEGSSGGPLLKGGKVVGIVNELLNQFVHATPATVIQLTLEGWGDQFILRRTTNFNGKWMSIEPDSITTVKTILIFEFKVEDGELTGTIHHGYQQAILNGKIDRDKITFDMDQEWELDGKRTVERQTYRGKFVGDKIQFVRTNAGSPPFEFTALRKVQQPLPLALRAGGTLANTKLAFSGRHIWTMNGNGTDKKRLIKGASDSEASPAWSPDGSKIAYEGHKTSSEFGIYVIHADGSNEKRLSQESEFWADPSWSPDGTRIVFANRSSKPGIVMANADGSHLTRLTTGDSDAVPSFSPDGTKILFHGRNGIVVMDADGSNPRKLGEGNHPVWSPDGTKIAIDREGAENSSQIIVMNADGSNPATLAEDWARATHPAWSPDGSLIAFVSNREGESEIFVMGADGSNPVNVSNLLGGYESIAWSPLLNK